MKDRVLIISQNTVVFEKPEALDRFYLFVRLLAADNEVFFLSPDSSFEQAYIKRISRFVKKVSIARTLEELLREREYEHIIFKDYNLLKRHIREIRFLSPKSAVLAYVNDFRFYARGAGMLMYQNKYLSCAAEKAKINELTVYAQADFVISENQADRKIFIDQGWSPAKAGIINWSKASISVKKQIKDILLLASAFREKIPDELISIIIPCYNQLKYTKLCIKSIVKSGPPCYELIFVDNGSTDGTPEYLRTVEGARIISNSRNAGFAKACNQGIRASSGKYIVLLNNDTILTPGSIEKLYFCLKSASSIGLAGPGSNSSFGKQKIHNVPAFTNMEDLGRWAKVMSAGHTGEWEETFWLPGFCLMIKRQVLNKVGRLDEHFYPGGYEEYDFCLRARQKGFLIYCCRDAFVYHFGGKSQTLRNRLVLSKTAQKIFVKKWGYQPLKFLMDEI